MRRVRGAPLVLLGAGVVALVASRFGWDFQAAFLSLTGDLGELRGPCGLPSTWFAHLHDVAAALAVLAIVNGAVALWRPRRALAGATAVVLVLGAAWIVLWLRNPPQMPASNYGSLPGSIGYIYSNWTIVTIGALAVAAAAAGWITLRGAATAAKPQRAPAPLPPQHSPTPPH